MAVQPRASTLIIGDACDGPLDPVGPHVRALELCCSRAGVTVFTLPVSATEHLSEPISLLGPAMVVIAGGHVGDDQVARWAYAVRQAPATSRSCSTNAARLHGPMAPDHVCSRRLRSRPGR